MEAALNATQSALSVSHLHSWIEAIVACQQPRLDATQLVGEVWELLQQQARVVWLERQYCQYGLFSPSQDVWLERRGE